MSHHSQFSLSLSAAMTQSVPLFITSLVLMVTIYATAELQCGPNEVEESCPSSCESDYCPKCETYSRSCPKPEKCPPPACKCRFNFKRASNGTCISTRDCPPFKCSDPNARFDPCPPYCPTDDCSQASPQGGCPALFGNILVVVNCQPTCRCKKGYWKHKGICVPYARCPGKSEHPSIEPYII